MSHGSSTLIPRVMTPSGCCAGHRRFPLAEELSDDEDRDPGASPAASAAHPEAQAQQAQQLVNCLLVWRFEQGQAEAQPQSALGNESPQVEQQE